MALPSSVRFCVATLSVVAAALAFTGCQSSPTYSDQGARHTLTAFANSSWVLAGWTSAEGRAVPTVKSAVPTFQLGYDGAVSGNAGINRYFGKLKVKDGALDWADALASTRMAGAPEAMESEQRFMTDLKATDQVTVRGSRLIFSGKGKLKLEFVRE